MTVPTNYNGAPDPYSADLDPFSNSAAPLVPLNQFHQDRIGPADDPLPQGEKNQKESIAGQIHHRKRLQYLEERMVEMSELVGTQQDALKTFQNAISGLVRKEEFKKGIGLACTEFESRLQDAFQEAQRKQVLIYPRREELVEITEIIKKKVNYSEYQNLKEKLIDFRTYVDAAAEQVFSGQRDTLQSNFDRKADAVAVDLALKKKADTNELHDLRARLERLENVFRHAGTWQNAKMDEIKENLQNTIKTELAQIKAETKELGTKMDCLQDIEQKIETRLSSTAIGALPEAKLSVMIEDRFRGLENDLKKKDEGYRKALSSVYAGQVNWQDQQDQQDYGEIMEDLQNYEAYDNAETDLKPGQGGSMPTTRTNMTVVSKPHATKDGRPSEAVTPLDTERHKSSIIHKKIDESVSRSDDKRKTERDHGSIKKLRQPVEDHQTRHQGHKSIANRAPQASPIVPAHGPTPSGFGNPYPPSFQRDPQQNCRQKSTKQIDNDSDLHILIENLQEGQEMYWKKLRDMSKMMENRDIAIIENLTSLGHKVTAMERTIALLEEKIKDMTDEKAEKIMNDRPSFFQSNDIQMVKQQAQQEKGPFSSLWGQRGAAIITPRYKPMK